MRTYNLTLDNNYNQKDIHFYVSILLITYPVFYPASELFGHIGQYAIFSIWLLLSILKRPGFLFSILKNSGVYIFFYLIIFVRVASQFSLIDFGFYSPHRLLSQFLLLLVYYIFGLWQLKYSNAFIKKRLIIYFLIAYFLSSIISLYYLFENEYAIRRSADYGYFAVGDFNLVYTGVCLAVLLWITIITKYFNLKLIILFITICLLVIKANYMTAIALLAVLLIVSTVLKYNKKAIFFLVVISIVFLFGMERLGYTIAAISNLDFLSSVIKYRLSDIANLLINKDIINSNTIGDRLYLASRSWESFLSSPLLGVDYENYNSFTVGSHTQWVDNLARFGVIGFSLLSFQLAIWFFQIYKSAKGWWSKCSVVLTWILFFTLGIINNNMLGGLFICMFFVSNNIYLFKVKN